MMKMQLDGSLKKMWQNMFKEYEESEKKANKLFKEMAKMATYNKTSPNINYDDAEMKWVLDAIEREKKRGKPYFILNTLIHNADMSIFPRLIDLGYKVEFIYSIEWLQQHKISWDMEKLTAAEAKKIALSKSDLVSEMVSDCLGHIKSQAEKGKFSCTLTAIYNESNVEAIKQLRELGYSVAYVYDNMSMDIIISW